MLFDTVLRLLIASEKKQDVYIWEIKAPSFALEERSVICQDTHVLKAQDSRQTLPLKGLVVHEDTLEFQ